MLFSIIVPVYNIENWVVKCIDSIVSQTFSDFELILVDDGSTDGSAEICDRYGTSYSFVHVFHKANGGLSDARNYGTQYAAGEYILFVDGDDYLAPNALQILYDQICKDSPDVVLADGQYNAFPDHTEIIKKFNKEDFKSLNGKEALLRTSRIAPNWSAWGKAYKRSFWEKNEFSFKKGRLAEDLQLIDRVILAAESVSMVPAYYYYQYRDDSIVHSVSPKLLLDLLDNFDDWEQYFEKANLSAQLEEQIRAMHALVLCHNVLSYMYVIDKNDIKFARKRAERHLKDLKCSGTLECRTIYAFWKVFGIKATCAILGKIKIRRLKG